MHEFFIFTTISSTIFKTIKHHLYLLEFITFSLQTETALIYDAVHLFARALNDLDHSQEIDTHPLSCDGTQTWQHGNSLVNYMKLVIQQCSMSQNHPQVRLFLLKLTFLHSLYAKLVKERITFFHAFSTLQAFLTLHAFLFISL